MKTFRVAVIGHTGRGNYGHGLDRVWQDIPSCQLVAVADADQQGREQALKRLGITRGYADYRAMLDKEKPDVVSIAPRWLDQHCEMVVAAAERGIHIYQEKPMCRTLAEADRMVAACEKHKVKLAIAFQTRYSPKLQAVRDLIWDGRLGKILELRGRGKEDRRGGGEDLWVLGSHVMNLIHQFGGEPNWCYATVSQDGQPITAEHVQPGSEGIGPLAGDVVQAMYGLDDDVTAYFGSHRNAAGGRFGLQIYGSKGVLEILTGHLPSVQFLADPAWSPGRSEKAWQSVSSAGLGQPEPLTDGGLHAGNVLACQDLLAAIQEDRQPEASVYEARTTVEMIAAVFESQRLGRPVTLPLATRENPLTLL
jgi:predicted dehydrogenase